MVELSHGCIVVVLELMVVFVFGGDQARADVSRDDLLVAILVGTCDCCLVSI